MVTVYGGGAALGACSPRLGVRRQGRRAERRDEFAVAAPQAEAAARLHFPADPQLDVALRHAAVADAGGAGRGRVMPGAFASPSCRTAARGRSAVSSRAPLCRAR
jgi:hypothetical protein